MLRNRLYYGVKPLVPRSIRMVVRSWMARRMRERAREHWPILRGAEQPPEGWPGWPEGKEFALVLTHDVEGVRGLENLQAVVDLELSLGFRSAVNLVPEGEYAVPKALVRGLQGQGIEVGVHDLRHDGKLYRSRQDFSRHAARINRYLKEWGAVGFRSGFMLHNLSWLRELNVLYDASTFDTDPFEPQPDGVGTIFPFWVPRHGSGTGGRQSGDREGYLELPYTLPQDSTLFLLLRERHPDIWFQKLDWIARHGGMALINVHPDYIRTGEGNQSLGTFPLEHYKRFLEYAATRYQGRFWQVTPRELAAWYVEHARDRINCQTFDRIKSARLQDKRVGVVLYSHYPSDPRPRREAEALAEAGMQVDVISLREKPNEPAQETIAGVNVIRIPIRRRRESKLTYVWQYGMFFCSSAAILTWRMLRGRYHLVHAHNMPDFLAFAGLAPKLLGARVILDLHDPMPELMMSIYDLPASNRLVGLLKRLEKWSIAFADLVLTPNLAFQRLFVFRGCPADKIRIVMNTPKTEVFDPVKYVSRNGAPGRFKLMYHGLLVKRHGLDTAIEAVASLRRQIPGIEFHIYGNRTSYMDEVDALIEKLDAKALVVYHGHKSQPEIAQAIAGVNLGLIPNRRSPFTEINMPTRVFENLAMRKPVLAPDTQGIRDYFDSTQMLFFRPGDPQDLARAILWAHDHPTETQQILEGGLRVYRQHLWPEERAVFLDAVASLFNKD